MLEQEKSIFIPEKLPWMEMPGDFVDIVIRSSLDEILVG